VTPCEQVVSTCRHDDLAVHASDQELEDILRNLIALMAATMLIASPVMAQSTQTAPAGATAQPASPGTDTATGSSNSAVNGTGNAGSDVNASGTVNVVAASALEKGANSFTEGQAKSRLASAGFTNVSDLKKDDQGIWRGTAMRNGKNQQVGFDYKGNIGAQ